MNTPKLCRGFGRHPLVRASNRLISYWNSTLAVFSPRRLLTAGIRIQVHVSASKALARQSAHVAAALLLFVAFAKIVSKISTSFSFEKSFLIASSSCRACYTRICFKSTRFVLLYLAMSKVMAFGFFFDCVCHTSIYKQRWMRERERDLLNLFHCRSDLKRISFTKVIQNVVHIDFNLKLLSFQCSGLYKNI